MADEPAKPDKQPDPAHYLSMISQAFTGLFAAITDLRTGANDEQEEALDVFQASIYQIENTEAHSVRSAFS